MVIDDILKRNKPGGSSKGQTQQAPAAAPPAVAQQPAGTSKGQTQQAVAQQPMNTVPVSEGGTQIIGNGVQIPPVQQAPAAAAQPAAQQPGGTSKGQTQQAAEPQQPVTTQQPGGSSKGQTQQAANVTQSETDVTQQEPAKEKIKPLNAVPASEGGTQVVGNDVQIPAVNGGQQASQRMSYVDMLNMLHPQLTPEEIEQQKKKEKRDKMFAAIGDGISAIANLIGTANYAPNMFNAANSMSAKARERYDKLNKEREENSRYYTNAYMNALKADQDAADKDRSWKHALEREGVEDKRYDEKIAYQKERDAKADDKWEKQFQQSEDHWNKQFKESMRQFNVSSAQRQQSLNMEAKRLAHSMANDSNTVDFTTSSGNISVPKKNLTANNISYVFNYLPDEIKKTIGKPIYDKISGMNIIGYQAPTTDAMLIAIGAYSDSHPEVRAALKRVAGQKAGASGESNTPPSMRGNKNNDNTPPSMRK